MDGDVAPLEGICEPRGQLERDDISARRARPGTVPAAAAPTLRQPRPFHNHSLGELQMEQPGPFCADSVAKVVLRKVSKILRAAGAVFV
jgi:hypothetical protein